MREIRPSGSAGGAGQLNAPFLPRSGGVGGAGWKPALRRQGMSWGRSGLADGLSAENGGVNRWRWLGVRQRRWARRSARSLLPELALRPSS